MTNVKTMGVKRNCCKNCSSFRKEVSKNIELRKQHSDFMREHGVFDHMEKVPRGLNLLPDF